MANIATHAGKPPQHILVCKAKLHLTTTSSSSGRTYDTVIYYVIRNQVVSLRHSSLLQAKGVDPGLPGCAPGSSRPGHIP